MSYQFFKLLAFNILRRALSNLLPLTEFKQRLTCRKSYMLLLILSGFLKSTPKLS